MQSFQESSVNLERTQVTIPILPESVTHHWDTPDDPCLIQPTAEDMEAFKYAALDGRLLGGHTFKRNNMDGVFDVRSIAHTYISTRKSQENKMNDGNTEWSV